MRRVPRPVAARDSALASFADAGETASRMYCVSVRDHVMIAHSFKGELFGPAQRLHGATYVVDVQLRRESLDPNGVVVDIGRATQALGAVLADFAYRNLDELAEFEGKNTTTEFMAREIFERMWGRIVEGELGSGSEGLHSMRVTLNESHAAWASYEADLPPLPAQPQSS